MRTYGRIRDTNNALRWVIVETDANGNDDLVWVTTLCQCLLLNLNESPFFAQYGIPAKPSVVQQVQPDYYITRMQLQFSRYFANLIIAKEASFPEPVYKVNITTNQGVRINATIAK